VVVVVVQVIAQVAKVQIVFLIQSLLMVVAVVVLA
jgi:hypothetical protein